MADLKKTVFCKSGGCTAKLGAGALRRILEKLPRPQDPRLLVGFEASDDAAVYRAADGIAIVHTLDFFPPVVEDPYLYGQIAAANALSDVWAMGGKPVTALNIVCFPEALDMNLLGSILQGGAEKVREAGASLAGGHSILDDGVKYGLSVTGIVHPEEIWRNNACQEGDALLLSKPIGVGIVCAAARAGQASQQALAMAHRSMATLNRYAAEVLHGFQTHAVTDVTGFSLLGHLTEMLDGRFSAVLEAEAIPRIPGCAADADACLGTAAGQRNRNSFGAGVSFEGSSFATEELLFDPQTSGGLLSAVAPADAPQALRALRALGLPCGRIGTVVSKGEKAIRVKGEIR